MVENTSGRIRYRAGLLCSVGATTAIGLSAPAGSVAQDSTQMTSTTAAASSSNTNLEEIVVTSQKRKERLQDVPISISVLGGKDLDHSTIQGVSEQLSLVPGIATSTNTQAGGSVVSIRGVGAGSPVFAGSSPVSYYLDSVPFGLVQNSIAPDASAFDLDRVEVLRGPQGTLYGASAQAGVIRVLTKDPDLNEFDLKFRASDSGTNGGGNNYRGDLAANIPIIDGKLGARAVVGYQSLSGWIDTPIRNDSNNAVLKTARLKINAQPTEDLSIGASAWSSRANYGGPSAGYTAYARETRLNEAYNNDYDSYGLKIVYDFHTFTLSSSSSYLKFSSAGVIDPYFLLGGLHTPEPLAFDSNVLSEEINLTSKGTGPWRWSAGAFYRNATDNDFIALQSILTYDWTNTSRSYALFGELSRLFLDDKFEWKLGARYFHDDVTSKEGQDVPPLNPPNYYRAESKFTAPTPRAVLTWHPNALLSTYASFSEGFRSGTPQAYYTVGGQPGFPPAKPDKLYNYEIGAKGDMSILSFEAAVYYMKWKDVQQQINIPFQGIYVAAIVNGASASGAGIDLAITAHPINGWEFGGTFSYNHLQTDADILSAGRVLFTKGDRLNFSPEYTAGLFVDYSFPLVHGYTGKMSVSGNDTASQCFKGSTGGAPTAGCGNPVVMTHAGLSIQAPSHWQMTLFGDNLNNFTGIIVQNPYYGPSSSGRTRPRTIGLQFDYHF